MGKRVLITGGTGLIGQKLTKALQFKGFEVAILSRNPVNGGDSGVQQFKWSVNEGFIDPKAWEYAEHIIHLAGAGIADKRWTNARKSVLSASRIDSTQLLCKELQKHDVQPSVYIGTSAIGFYGDRGSAVLDESSAVGNGYLAGLCQDWELAHQQMREICDEVKIARVGVVLSTDGGALPEITKTFPFGLASVIGSGKQIYSWIHIEDAVKAFCHLLEHKGNNTFNLTAPQPVSLKEMTHTLKRAYPRPTIALPAPAFIIRMAFGEMAAVVLDSCHAEPKQLIDSGFSFTYPTISEAANNLLRN